MKCMVYNLVFLSIEDMIPVKIHPGREVWVTSRERSLKEKKLSFMEYTM